MLLYIRAFWHLARFQHYLLRGNFALLYAKVRDYPCAPVASSSDLTEVICRAFDLACIWYPKRVLCLQRSAATVCLLREYGVSAQMVTGVQTFPFKAHAWVEVCGRVVNDKSYVREMYAMLDCC